MPLDTNPREHQLSRLSNLLGRDFRQVVRLEKRAEPALAIDERDNAVWKYVPEARLSY